MKGSNPTSKLTRLSLLLPLLIGSSVVHAGGFQLSEEAVSSMGNAYAGTAAVAEDASTNFYNPAGLTLLRAPELVASGVLLHVDSEADVKSATANSIIGEAIGIDTSFPVIGKNHQQIGGWNLIPALHVALPQCHRFAFGLSVTAPFGLNTHYDGDSKIKYLATWSKVSTIDVGPSVAFQVTPDFSVGAGLDVQYLKADLNQKIPVGESIPPIPPFIAGNFPDGEITNRGLDKHGLGWNAGALYQLNCGHTRLGASYRSRVHHHLPGEADLTVPPPLVDRTGFVDTTVTLPDYANLSFYHDINCKWALLGSVNWTHWSLIDTITLNYEGPIAESIETANLALAFRDTWRYSLGANYQLNCRWKLRAGVAYDQSPVRDDTRTFRLPDNDRYWAALGVQYKISECLLIDAGYNHLFVKDAPTNQTVSTTLANGDVITANAIADFDSPSVDSFGLQLTWRIL